MPKKKPCPEATEATRHNNTCDHTWTIGGYKLQASSQVEEGTDERPEGDNAAKPKTSKDGPRARQHTPLDI